MFYKLNQISLFTQDDAIDLNPSWPRQKALITQLRMHLEKMLGTDIAHSLAPFRSLTASIHTESLINTCLQSNAFRTFMERASLDMPDISGEFLKVAVHKHLEAEILLNNSCALERDLLDAFEVFSRNFGTQFSLTLFQQLQNVDFDYKKAIIAWQHQSVLELSKTQVIELISAIDTIRSVRNVFEHAAMKEVVYPSSLPRLREAAGFKKMQESLLWIRAQLTALNDCTAVPEYFKATKYLLNSIHALSEEYGHEFAGNLLSQISIGHFDIDALFASRYQPNKDIKKTLSSLETIYAFRTNSHFDSQYDVCNSVLLLICSGAVYSGASLPNPKDTVTHVVDTASDDEFIASIPDAVILTNQDDADTAPVAEKAELSTEPDDEVITLNSGVVATNSDESAIKNRPATVTQPAAGSASTAETEQHEQTPLFWEKPKRQTSPAKSHAPIARKPVATSKAAAPAPLASPATSTTSFTTIVNDALMLAAKLEERINLLKQQKYDDLTDNGNIHRTYGHGVSKLNIEKYRRKIVDDKLIECVQAQIGLNDTTLPPDRFQAAASLLEGIVANHSTGEFKYALALRMDDNKPVMVMSVTNINTSNKLADAEIKRILQAFPIKQYPFGAIKSGLMQTLRALFTGWSLENEYSSLAKKEYASKQGLIQKDAVLLDCLLKACAHMDPDQAFDYKQRQSGSSLKLDQSALDRIQTLLGLTAAQPAAEQAATLSSAAAAAQEARVSSNTSSLFAAAEQASSATSHQASQGNNRHAKSGRSKRK